MSAEPRWADLYGADPNFTLGMDASRYLTHQRGECPDDMPCALCVCDTTVAEVERLRVAIVTAYGMGRDDEAAGLPPRDFRNAPTGEPTP